MYVRINYSDGQFSMMPTSPAIGIYIGDEMWKRYEAFCKDVHFWYEILGALDNLEHYKREERKRKDV